MKKYIGFAITLLFCNATHAAVYMIDFKCEPEAYLIWIIGLTEIEQVMAFCRY